MDRIERNLYKLIAATLNEANFYLDKSKDCFIRNTSYGFDALMVINQGRTNLNQFGVHCVFEVRHDKIERPWNSFGFVYGEENQAATSTFLLAYPSPRLGAKSDTYKLKPANLQEDIAHVAQEIEQAFIQYATPFYNRFSHLTEVEKVLNKHPVADLTPYTAGGPIEHRAIRSLLCAKAVNPEGYDAVREVVHKVFLTKGMFPLELRLAMIDKVDKLVL